MINFVPKFRWVHVRVQATKHTVTLDESEEIAKFKFAVMTAT